MSQLQPSQTEERVIAIIERALNNYRERDTLDIKDSLDYMESYFYRRRSLRYRITPFPTHSFLYKDDGMSLMKSITFFLCFCLCV